MTTEQVLGTETVIVFLSAPCILVHEGAAVQSAKGLAEGECRWEVVVIDEYTLSKSHN